MRWEGPDGSLTEDLPRIIDHNVLLRSLRFRPLNLLDS